MGKNRAIKILGNILGNIVLHNLLITYTNKPESLPHLRSEVEAYRDNALEWASEFNWSYSDLEEIRLDALANFKRDIKKYYPDVNFPIEVVEKLMEETIEELMRS